ncbi:MAG: hypothetical protein QXG33_01460, partial [Candidatus Anstonellales archaeon]
MSSLDFLKPIVSKLPEVRPPRYPPTIKERFAWTGIALITFFVMYNISAVGVRAGAPGFDFLQVVTASRVGSLVTTGIGPIVLASIFLQLFAGAKIINIDLTNPDQRALFHGTQKLLAIILAFLEAAIFVIFARLSLTPLFPFLGESIIISGGIEKIYAPYTTLLVILQIALGSIILLFLDEVVSRYGFGSGISLFIAAGVSFSIISGIIFLFTGPGGVIEDLAAGGANAIAAVLLDLVPLFFTLLIFAVVIYAEGMKVEIPLAFERAKGLGGRFPI